MANGEEPQGLLGNLRDTLGSPSDIGLGLLGAAAATTGFGIPLAAKLALGAGLAGGVQRSRLQNEQARARLQDQARQRQARRGLLEQFGPQVGEISDQFIPDRIDPSQAGQPGILNAQPQTPSIIPSLLQDQKRQQMGLLLEAFPEAAGQALLGQAFPQQGRQTSLVQNLLAAGIDPSSPEGQEIIRKNLTGGDLQEALAMLQIQGLQTEQQQEQTEAQRTEQLRKSTIQGNVKRILELADLNEQRRRITQNPSSVVEDPLQSVGTLQRFSQLTNELAIEGGLQPLSDVQDRMTDAGRSALFQSKFSSTTAPDVVDRVLADKLEGFLEAARITGTEVDRDAIRSRIRQLRGGSQQGRPANGGNRNFRFNPETGALEPK